MAKRTVEESSLTAVADAIREGTGTSEPLVFPDGFVGGVKAMSNAVMYTEPADDDIPKVFFGANLPQTKDDAIMSFRYISKTEDIKGYCKTKAQGNSSMSYPKKNQTVKLYKDAECTEKLKVDFKGWGKQNKFCFKANWIDLTHARNIVSARLWGDVVKSRFNYAEIPELLRTSPNQGAVDGFPVKVYANGVYQGRYTINIPKDAWMANMDDELDEHCILCGENYVSGCFRAEAVIDGSDWSDEIHGTVPDAIKNRWNDAINFVRTSTDAEFVSGIGNYFDVASLIDYYIFGVVVCNMDGFGKNQLYHTYDGQKWFATVYDMDCTFGTYFYSLLAYNYARNSYEDFKNGGGNLLYIRLESLFVDEIIARYAELKNGALSLSNIINRFERFTDIAPPYLVEEDYAETTANGAFTDPFLPNDSNIQQIRDYIVNRYSYVDSYIKDLGNPNLLAGVTFSYGYINYITGDTADRSDGTFGVYEADYIPVEAGKTYTVNVENAVVSSSDAMRVGIKYYTTDHTYTSEYVDDANAFLPYTFTVPTNIDAAYLRLNFSAGYDDSVSVDWSSAIYTLNEVAE